MYESEFEEFGRLAIQNKLILPIELPDTLNSDLQDVHYLIPISQYYVIL